MVRAPDPVLSRPGMDVDPVAAATIQLVADLLATQAVSPGCVGLAAQQIGVAARVFSVDVSGHPKTRTCHGAFALCNAVVVSATFQGKSLVEQHQLVYGALGERMREEVHALSMQTLTPEQWEARRHG